MDSQEMKNNVFRNGFHSKAETRVPELERKAAWLRDFQLLLEDAIILHTKEIYATYPDSTLRRAISDWSAKQFLIETDRKRGRFYREGESLPAAPDSRSDKLIGEIRKYQELINSMLGIDPSQKVEKLNLLRKRYSEFEGSDKDKTTGANERQGPFKKTIQKIWGFLVRLIDFLTSSQL